ncbi:MAG: ATP-binding protein [Candidatus Poribacteria bacterium]|nr:ATP-binding protein [Candidatus Poribacteria bacterium]
MFWEQIKRHYNAGSAHEFLLHFNVQDLLYDDVYGYLPTFDYLMEQLNALGCDLVLGYNTSQGIIWPNIERWQNTQKMLKLIPAEQEEAPETERPRINANLAIDKLHEDPFINVEPDPSEELQEQLNNLLQQGRAKVGLVINFLEQLAPNDPSLSSGISYDLHRFFSRVQNWASDLEIRRRGHAILLLTQNRFDIHPSLTVNPEIPVIEISFPDYAQRHHFIEHLHAISTDSSQMRKTLGDDRDREILARDTIGLNLFGIHDVVRQAESVEEKAGGEPLVKYKRESIRAFSHGVLELGETHTNSDADGWYVMWTIRDIAEGMKNGDLQRVPRGILFLGPLGTSKIYAAQLLAGEANMTFVQLRYASQVGEVTVNINENGNSYERNLNAAISFIRGISPVVVFIDEIEQASPHTSIHPEERQPFPQSLVNAISDPSLHGRVIWVGASHRPDLMPQIFRQYGIFDTKFVMLPPIAEGRMEILRIFCQGQTESEINFRALVGGPDTDGLTWRDLFLIVQRAYNIGRHNQRQHFTETDLRQALDDFIPAYSSEMQLFMGLLALREATSRIMIPESLLPPYQEFVDENRIDKTGINKRLMELSDQLGLNA